MKRALLRLAFAVRRALKAVFDPAIGWLVVGVLGLVRRVDRVRLANIGGRVARRVGPWLPENRTGRANLAAAFPEKSAAEIEAILAGVWDNLGRVGAEFASLDRLRIIKPGEAGPADGVLDDAAVARLDDMRGAAKPTAVFAAHLANWEMPALVAAQQGVPMSVLYRPPNIRAAADAVVKIRAGCMGTLVPSRFDAPMRLARALERGEHVGMLVDQHEQRGVEVEFFGRPCKANPLIAQLARHTGCHIRGIRIVRQADRNSFWGELTAPLDLPRDASGEVDIQATMQAITSVIEGWVREHPEQWLWLHRRWR